MKIEKAAKLLANKTHAIRCDRDYYETLRKVLILAFPKDKETEKFKFDSIFEDVYYYGFNRYDEGQWANVGSYLEELEHINLSEIDLIEPEKISEKPIHYQTENNIDIIDFCKMYNLNFNRGNVIKYVARAGKKDDEIKDLEKALDFIKREIKYLKEK